MDKIMADQSTRSLFQDEPSGFLTCGISNQGVGFVTYPCRSDELLNCAIFHKTRGGQTDANDWNAPATVAEALAVLEGFHPAWRAIVEKADFMKVYVCGYRDPLPRMAKGKVVLIGDAAHPMMPPHAQGGCMALEDAAALEVLMADMNTCHDSVERRLQLFQEVRLPRCATTQIVSNAMFYSHRLDQQDLVRKYYQGPLPPLDAQGFSKPFHDFFYAYDVFEECDLAMPYKENEGGMPDGLMRYFWPPN